MAGTEQQAHARAAIHKGHHTGPDTPVIALPFSATAASAQLVGRDCILMGCAVVEASGTVSAAVEFCDGGDANATTLVPYTLGPGQSARDPLSAWGLAAQQGVFLKVISGTVKGVIWVVLP